MRLSVVRVGTYGKHVAKNMVLIFVRIVHTVLMDPWAQAFKLKAASLFPDARALMLHALVPDTKQLIKLAQSPSCMFCTFRVAKHASIHALWKCGQAPR